MTENGERKPYWRQSKMLMVTSLVWPCLLLVGIPYWFGMLGPYSLAGLPIGYLLAVHGVVLLSIVVIARFATVQEQVDRWHGTHEDG